jgi:hypothetical protein
MEMVLLNEDGSVLNRMTGVGINNGRLYTQRNNRPIFNSRLLDKNGLTKNDIVFDNLADAFAKFSHIIFVKGMNPCGREMITKAEYTDRKESEVLEKLKSGEIVINFYNSFFGLACGRLPNTVWQLIKPFGTYHSADESDMEWVDDSGNYGAHESDVRGWYYTDEVFDVLNAAGYTTTFDKILITATSVIGAIAKEIAAREQAKSDAIQANKFAFAELKLAWNIETLHGDTPKEGAPELSGIEKLAEIHILGAKGHNIYGSGNYYAISDKYLYDVKNNSMDGDAWAWSNWNGSIVKVYPITDKIKSLVTDIATVEKESREL